MRLPARLGRHPLGPWAIPSKWGHHESSWFGNCDDKLLLDFKGTMSEAELHWLRLRLTGARRRKASRGELRFPPPTGYALARVVLAEFHAEGTVETVVLRRGLFARAGGRSRPALVGHGIVPRSDVRITAVATATGECLWETTVLGEEPYARLRVD